MLVNVKRLDYNAKGILGGINMAKSPNRDTDNREACEECVCKKCGHKCFDCCDLCIASKWASASYICEKS